MNHYTAQGDVTLYLELWLGGNGHRAHRDAFSDGGSPSSDLSAFDSGGLRVCPSTVPRGSLWAVGSEHPFLERQFVGGGHPAPLPPRGVDRRLWSRASVELGRGIDRVNPFTGVKLYGYLLPWDQRAYWAVTISTGMLDYVPLLGPWVAKLVRGGIEIGEPTLAHFFVMHVAFLPLTLLFLVVWHFWLVRQSGGLVQRERPGPRTESVLRVPTVPDLVVREAAVGFVLVAFVLVLSILANAPLGEMANPGVSPQPAKAPWYFMGFQELLLHVHPLWAVTVWPILGVGALVGVSFWPGAVSPPGVWFGSQRGKQLAVRVAIGSVFLGVGLLLLDDVFLSSGSVPGVFSRGIFPTGLLLGGGYGFYRLMVRRFRYTRAEVVTAGFVGVTVLWIVLTAIGVWFRGPEMGLAWPWSF
jgi:hypothetical protein